MTKEEFKSLGITKYDLVAVTFIQDDCSESAWMLKEFGFADINNRGEIAFCEYLSKYEDSSYPENPGLFHTASGFKIKEVELIKKNYWSEK